MFDSVTGRKKQTEAEADERLCTDKEKMVERERNCYLDIPFFDNRNPVNCLLTIEALAQWEDNSRPRFLWGKGQQDEGTRASWLASAVNGKTRAGKPVYSNFLSI